METQEKIEARRPEFVMGWPAWWHHHGMKMKVFSQYPIRIIGSAANISIQRLYSHEGDTYKIRWAVYHGEDNLAVGTIHFTQAEIEAAFCLKDYIDPTSEAVITKYGGSSIVPGKFIRWERWLNVPMPGTGLDGDPNISIEVTDEMKDAVRQYAVDR